MNRRAIFIALMAAMACVTFLLLYMRQYERETSGGERVRLLVALKPLTRGTKLTDALLASRDVPAAYVDSRAIKESERAKILGITVADSVQSQDVLMWTDLTLGNEERDLSALVQPGNRAVTVRATDPEETKVHALIHPGDYVDVLATIPGPAPVKGGPPSDEKISVVLLQRALVLAVGLATQASGGGTEVTTHGTAPSSASQRDLVLTLSLDLQSAQLVALAADKGRLTVAVRNPDDQRVSEALPDLSSTALFDAKTRADMEKGRRTGVVSTLLTSVTTPVAVAPVRLQRARADR
jgi:pilus assembly protein CpaB